MPSLAYIEKLEEAGSRSRSNLESFQLTADLQMNIIEGMWNALKHYIRERDVICQSIMLMELAGACISLLCYRKDLGPADVSLIINYAKDLHTRKSAGYAGMDSDDPWINFRGCEDLGVDVVIGVYIRMSDKFIRIKNLLKNPDNEQVGEALEDTVFDLGAYALIAACLLDEQAQAAME